MGDDLVIHITEGDTEDWIFDVLNAQTDAARDLTGATVVLYMWSHPGSSVVIDGESCSHDDTGGQVTYSPAVADVDDPGTYQIQLKITLAGGDIKRYPDPQVQGRIYLHIHEAVENTDTSA